jgi:hypothetical protein
MADRREKLNFREFLSDMQETNSDKGEGMSCNFTSVLSFCFAFIFWGWVGVHYSSVKSPSGFRGLASSEFKPTVKPLYDASFKL